MDTWDAVLKTRGNVFVKKSKIFRPMFENGQIFISTSILFQKIFLPSKCSEGQTEGSFDKRVETFPVKGQKIVSMSKIV